MSTTGRRPQLLLDSPRLVSFDGVSLSCSKLVHESFHAGHSAAAIQLTVSLHLQQHDCRYHNSAALWWVSLILALMASLCKKQTHTHPFNSPLSGTTQVSWYQKGKTNLDFTEARDSEWQWHQTGHMQVCISLQTDNHASTPSLSFLQAGCPSCRPTNSVKERK